MTRFLAVLLLAGCTPALAPPPVMAPVDTASARAKAVPKEAATPCAGIPWPPITLPTSEAEQIEGRASDRAMADAALAECDRRRAAGARRR